MKQVLLLTVNKYATVQNVVTITILHLVFMHPCSWECARMCACMRMHTVASLSESCSQTLCLSVCQYSMISSAIVAWYLRMQIC